MEPIILKAVELLNNVYKDIVVAKLKDTIQIAFA